MKRADLFTSLVKRTLQVDVVREYRFHPKRRWRIDYAVPQYRVALEVEGGVWVRGRHVRGRGFLDDMEKYNALTTCGWRLLRTTPDALTSAATLAMLEETIEQVKRQGDCGAQDAHTGRN